MYVYFSSYNMKHIFMNILQERNSFPIKDKDTFIPRNPKFILSDVIATIDLATQEAIASTAMGLLPDT